MTKRGCFISLEGGEGAGKSTQVRALSAELRKRGVDVLETREPGGSPGAEAIRRLLLDPSEDWSARSEALLFAAARADHVEKTIEPALRAGRWVVSDRFVDSSLAYQGGAGGLEVPAIQLLHQFGSAGFLPDRTLVLRVDDGAARARERDGDEVDRIGGRPASYHHQVERAFDELARDDPDRVRLIDATGAPREVTRRLFDAIADLLR